MEEPEKKLIDPDVLTQNAVVFDTGGKGPAERRYFRVLAVEHPQAGPWQLAAILGGARRTVRVTELNRFRAVEAEPYAKTNFEGFVGQTVELETRWSSKVHGVVTFVRTYAVTFQGAELQLPEAFIIDGEAYRMADVASVRIV